MLVGIGYYVWRMPVILTARDRASTRVLVYEQNSFACKTVAVAAAAAAACNRNHFTGVLCGARLSSVIFHPRLRNRPFPVSRNFAI